jgi:hypothetical protein
VSVLADIETRLSALEALVGAQAVDTLQPNYLTVNPDGTIGADFTGEIHAEGLVIPAGSTSAPPDVNRVIWERQSDGAVVAQAWGTEVAGGETLLLAAEPTVATNGSAVELLADTGGFVGSTAYAQLVLQRGGVGAADGTTQVSATANTTHGPQSATVVDATGASSFLQLAILEQLALSIGVAVLNFPSSQFATAVTVNHGLGRVPDIALGAPRTPNSFYVLPNVVEGSVNANSFQLTAFCPQGSPGNENVGVTWYAIG